MAEATCRRELDLEIPAEEVSKAMERVAKEFARIANVPGLRGGKGQMSLIRRRVADDIKGEVLQSLVPERVEKAVAEQKLTPVSQPQVDKLDYAEGQPLKFRAVFEVLPDFELGNYKGLEIELPAMDVTNEDVAKALEEMRERAAAFAPVEGRAVENGDFVQLKLLGTPAGGGDPLQADNVLCHVGAEETMAAVNENQRDHKHKELLHEKILAALVKLHDFPVPEALVEHQMDVRLERVVRSLAAQGVDPRAVNVDWVTLRRRQQERAADDVKAELIVDRIASAESIDVTEQEVDQELQHLAGHGGESAEAIRARLTKQGALDRIKAKLRSDKTLDWLAQNSRIKTVAAASAK